MEQVVTREQLIRKYVFGDLAEEEETQVELGLLTDETYLNLLGQIEAELTDDYLVGALSDYDRRRVGGYVYSALKLREKHNVRRLITQRLSETPLEDTNVEWETQLGEAEKNRQLLDCLINPNWNGLQLLALLSVEPLATSDLASRLSADEPTIAPMLSRLVQTGLAEDHNGSFSCGALGLEALQKLEAVAEMPFTP